MIKVTHILPEDRRAVVEAPEWLWKTVQVLLDNTQSNNVDLSTEEARALAEMNAELYQEFRNTPRKE